MFQSCHSESQLHAYVDMCKSSSADIVKQIASRRTANHAGPVEACGNAFLSLVTQQRIYRHP